MDNDKTEELLNTDDSGASSDQPKKKNNKTLFIIIGIVLILLLAGGGAFAYFYVFNNEEANFENIEVSEDEEDIEVEEEEDIVPATEAYSEIIELYQRAKEGTTDPADLELLYSGYNQYQYDDRNYAYSLIDLNDDGYEELVIIDTDMSDILGIFTVDDNGEVVQLLNGMRSRRGSYFLANDNTIGYMIAANGTWYSFADVTDNGVEYFLTTGNAPDGNYYKNDSSEKVDPSNESLTSSSTVITETEYNDLIDQYSQTNISYKNLSDY